MGSDGGGGGGGRGVSNIQESTPNKGKYERAGFWLPGLPHLGLWDGATSGGGTVSILRPRTLHPAPQFLSPPPKPNHRAGSWDTQILCGLLLRFHFPCSLQINELK